MIDGISLALGVILGGFVFAVPLGIVLHLSAKRAYQDECASHDATLRRAVEERDEHARQVDTLCATVDAATTAPEPERAGAKRVE